MTKRDAFRPARIAIDRSNDPPADWIINDIRIGSPPALGAPAFVLDHRNHDPGDEDRRPNDGPTETRLISQIA